MATKKTLVSEIEAVLAEKAGEIVSEALNRRAANAKNPTDAILLRIAADVAGRGTTEALKEVGPKLADLVSGKDPLAALALRRSGATVLNLSLLTQKLQDAEAADKKRMTRLAKGIGATLGDVGEVLAKAAVAALA